MSIPSFYWLPCLAAMLTSLPAWAEAPAAQAQSAPPAATTVTSMRLTLDSAIKAALDSSPRLQSFDKAIAAAKGNRQQAGVWANPEVGIEAENVAGSGNYRGINAAEITYGVSQQFQIGGKIGAREDIATQALEIAKLDYQAATLDLIRDITVTYMEAVAAQENMRLAREQKSLAEEVLESVSFRVDAAAAPLIQKSRAEVERSAAAIALDKATRERNIAHQNLAALLGEDHADFRLDSAAFFEISKPNELATHTVKGKSADDSLFARNPSLKKLDTSLTQSEAQLALEEANAIPDPRVNLGLRDLRSSDDQALVLGVSLPIPVFNANRGNIEKARQNVSHTALQNRQMRLNTHAELVQAQQRMENTYMQADLIEREIFPSANKAFTLAREGYGLGRFLYLEVLDAQRSLFAIRQQRIAAFRDYHIAQAQWERLTAAALDRYPDSATMTERPSTPIHGEADAR